MGRIQPSLVNFPSQRESPVVQKAFLWHDITLNQIHIVEITKHYHRQEKYSLSEGHLWFYYRQTSSISRTKSINLHVYRLVLQMSLPNPLKPDVKSKREMYLSSADRQAPTTSEGSTSLFPTKVRLILEVWSYVSLLPGNHHAQPTIRSGNYQPLTCGDRVNSV